MKPGIRHRLLTIVLLGVVTSALSVVALVHLLATTTAQRVERARDALVEETDRIARDPAALDDPTNARLIGMRAGVWNEAASPRALSPEWGAIARDAAASARAEGRRVVREAPLEEGTLVVAAEPLRGRGSVAAEARAGDVAYAAYIVKQTPSLRAWQRIVSLLAAATVLLVGTALYSVVTVGRAAAALRRSLDALATNLRAPVPRASVRELDGIAEGIAGLAEKLADARAKEERLARELADNERLAALGRVVAGVAHEVRNPLASIKLRLDLAATAASLPPAAESGIAHATSEIDRLDRLVRDLLFLSGRAIGPKGKSDVAALARARAEALAPWADERRVAIDVSGEGSAVIDADALARAIDNLLRNAVEASPEGTRVALRVATRDGGRVTIDVEDPGPGVAPERVAELFEPFFTTKPSGTGLGLAISRAVARAHGGDVTYAREDAVTRFALSVAASSSTSSTSSGASGSGSSRAGQPGASGRSKAAA